MSDNAYEYFYSNVGRESGFYPIGVEYFYSNVETYAPIIPVGAEYFYSNVGTDAPIIPVGAEYFYSNVGRESGFYPIGVEYFYSYLPDVPALPNGPNWASAADGSVEWIPGLIWNGSEFKRYQIWDGNSWQISA